MNTWRQLEKRWASLSHLLLYFILRNKWYENLTEHEEFINNYMESICNFYWIDRSTVPGCVDSRLVCTSPTSWVHSRSGDVRWHDRSQDRTRDCDTMNIVTNGHFSHSLSCRPHNLSSYSITHVFVSLHSVASFLRLNIARHIWDWLQDPPEWSSDSRIQQLQ